MIIIYTLSILKFLPIVVGLTLSIVVESRINLLPIMVVSTVCTKETRLKLHSCSCTMVKQHSATMSCTAQQIKIVYLLGTFLSG